MNLWHDIGCWPRAGEEMAAEKEPFWDLTGLVRRALCRQLMESGPPEKLLLTLTADGSEACDRFERELIALGDRVRRKSHVCLKAVCGHIALETIQVIRIGNTDFRLSHFPNAFYFSVYPPRMEPDGEPSAPATGVEPEPLNLSPIRTRPDGYPDPAGLLDLAEGVESGFVETQVPQFCNLEFLSTTLGLPLGDPAIWWAHLCEGRSVWDIEVQDLTVKVSTMGEVVRTLAVSNGFRQEFTCRV